MRSALGAIAVNPISNTSTFEVFTTSGGGVTNAQLSGTAIAFQFCYPAS